MFVTMTRRRDCGGVAMEFVLAFPLVLLLILGAVQASHLWAARTVVHYAAYCAARAGLVCREAEFGSPTGPKRAAERVCSWVVMGEQSPAGRMQLPGWGPIPNSGSVADKTRVTVSKFDDWNVEAEVQLDFAMIVPIVGPLIAWSVNPFPYYDPSMEFGNPYRKRFVMAGSGRSYPDMVSYPHITLRDRASLSKPYVTVTPTGW